jgi:predicted TIM-barrel fold metal-dependent hydrolase
VKETRYEKIKQVLEDTLALDDNKVIFGTDYAMCDIRSHIKLIDDLNISNNVKEKVFFENA